MKKAAVVLTALFLSMNVASYAQADTTKKVHHKKTTTHKTSTSKDSTKSKM